MNSLYSTGRKKGALQYIETQIDSPVQWVICMFHFAELPVRHIFYHYDGEPKGPIGPAGEIGSRIKHLNDNLSAFVDYQTIQCNIQFVPRELFRKKQDLIVLYDLVLAVINGVGSVDPVYLTKKLSEISTVRWNTTFSRHSDPKLRILIIGETKIKF